MDLSQNISSQQKTGTSDNTTYTTNLFSASHAPATTADLATRSKAQESLPLTADATTSSPSSARLQSQNTMALLLPATASSLPVTMATQTQMRNCAGLNVHALTTGNVDPAPPSPSLFPQTSPTLLKQNYENYTHFNAQPSDCI